MARGQGWQLLATVLSAVVAPLVILGSAPARAAAGGESDEAAFLGLVNQERAARGLGRLVAAEDLVAVARRHSARMAAEDRVFHNPGLGSEVEGWELVGENVGIGPTAQDIHEALMASDVHRAVILQPRFTQLGVGVVVDGAEIWLTEVFRQPEAQSQSAGSAAPDETAAETAAPVTAPPATTTATSSPIATPRRVQVAGRGPGNVATAAASPPSTSLDSTSGTTNAPIDVELPVEPVIIESAGPEAIEVPLPEPVHIPEVGLLAAGLLLAVVGGASVTTRRVVAPG